MKTPRYYFHASLSGREAYAIRRDADGMVIACFDCRQMAESVCNNLNNPRKEVNHMKKTPMKPAAKPAAKPMKKGKKC